MIVKHIKHFETNKLKHQVVAISIFVGFVVMSFCWGLSYFEGVFEKWSPIILGSFVAFMTSVILKVWAVKGEFEHSKAVYSHQIFEIASATLPYLRTGLNEKSAGEVARILIKNIDAMAVALTNLTTILAFSGAGEDHHQAGGLILTEATKEVLKYNEARVLKSKKEIGCPVSNCPLSAAIAVPLELRNKVAGALKFYYSDKEELTESRITFTEGLAKLLSTQLELSEIDRQEGLACKAELKALQAQINPHFLFNTLNTIASLCRTDSKKARKLIIQFADFFRKSLERDSDLVTLEEEIDYLNTYLLLEEARFGKNLQILEDVDKEVLGIKIPFLIIQPLVENAIKHGGTLWGHIKVKIAAKIYNSEVIIQVCDNGKGISEKNLSKILSPGFGKGTGIGLSNVNERLKSLYGEEYALEVTSTKNKETKVVIHIPITGENDED
ncbi:histidine kinase [Candidatus Oleimmundimicrobium sp.]|uniref:histidine kinase n=1 Tax=Candidatus Oleimmundimicrobium sp. TaxID=3060597 RepID=UPI002725A61B|nr:histidine kinase [Candidatus Oleimmundimicrobium sp.]MDO8886248.1 histidine kinase [Candidatus Oleimmundimicrobium sp.]